MKTEITNKHKALAIVGLLVLAVVTIVYLVMLFIAKEQISSPLFEILIGLGLFVLVMLAKFVYTRKT